MSKASKKPISLVSSQAAEPDELSVTDTRIKYPELGQLIMRWRKAKFSSALSLVGRAEFSFKYHDYWEFENGVNLPTPLELEQIAMALEKDPRDAMVAWAQTQMPTAEYKALFTPKYFGTIDSGPGFLKRAFSGSVDPMSHQIPASEAQDTWVLTDSDRVCLNEQPWLLRLLSTLQASWPYGVHYKQLGITKQLEFSAFKAAFLQSWITAGHIKDTVEDLNLGNRHFLIPNTEAWEPIRRTYAAMIFSNQNGTSSPSSRRDGQAYRSTMIKCVSKEHQGGVIKQFQNAEMDLKLIQSPSPDDTSAVTLEVAIVIGPAASIVPDSVLKMLKK